MQNLSRSVWADVWKREIKESTFFEQYRPDAVAYWDYYAHKYDEAHAFFHASVLDKVLKHISPKDVVLDIGAGTGTLTLPFAQKARSVLAIEPAKGMRRRLQQKISESGIANIKVLDTRWEAAEITARYDLAFSSLTAYFFNDIQESIEKMMAVSKRILCLLLIAKDKRYPYEKIWSILKGRPYRPGPDYDLLVSLLEDLGVEPTVEIIEADGRFPDLTAAMKFVVSQIDVSHVNGKEEEISSVITPVLDWQEDGGCLWKGMCKFALISAEAGG
ncbi:MAG: class I SAM-dependent methyltransferase [Nitrospiria bacterium]